MSNHCIKLWNGTFSHTHIHFICWLVVVKISVNIILKLLLAWTWRIFIALNWLWGALHAKIARFPINMILFKMWMLTALYWMFFPRLHLDLPILENNQNPSDSYDHLRKIVHTIAQEVIKLPEFYNQKGFSSVDAKQVQSSFEPKVYEDLLATAVINKVRVSNFIIDRFIHLRWDSMFARICNIFRDDSPIQP